MSDIVNTNQPIEQTLDEPLTKPKKPRTAKQLEAFKKVQEKRQQNIKEKNEQKLIEGAKLMLQQQEKAKQTVPPTPPPTPEQPKRSPLRSSQVDRQPKPKRKHEILSEYTEVDQSDSEEEVVIVKKSKPKPKKKVTRVIIESDSDSGNDSDDEDENYEPPRIWRSNINVGDFFC